MDKIGNWLAGFSDKWMNWWKGRAINFNLMDENTPQSKKSNPFYWIGSMIYTLLILQVCVGIILTFFYIPDTSPVTKIDPNLVTYAHGKTYAKVMHEAELIHEAVISEYDFSDDEREIFRVAGKKDYEVVIENLGVESDEAVTLEQFIELGKAYKNEIKDLEGQLKKAEKLEDSPEKDQQIDEINKELDFLNQDENIQSIISLSAEKADSLVASTYHAGMPIGDAITEADLLVSDIVELSSVYGLTTDQAVLMLSGIEYVDEYGDNRTIEGVLEIARKASGKSEEEQSDFEKTMLPFADYTPEQMIEEVTLLDMPVDVAIAEAELKLSPVFEYLEEHHPEEYEELASEFAELLALSGKSPETIADEAGVIITRAYDSVAKISSKPLTQWIRGIHRYGAYAFISLLMLRWVRMYFCGEFKKPGELTWIILTIVVVVSTFSGVTGYLLPFDQRAYWATTVGTQMLDSLDSMPVIGSLNLGAALKYIGLGANQVGQTTILRFNILHYFLPILMFLMAEIYFLRSRRKRPRINWVAIGLLLIVIVGACLYLPAVNEPPPNTVKTPDHILPDWYFLFVYFYLKFVPGYWGPLITVLFIVFLVFMPWIERRAEQSAKNRPDMITLGIGGLTFFLIGSLLSYWVLFKDSDRILYLTGIIGFNGLIFLLAFVLFALWRWNKVKRKNRLADRLGIDPAVVEIKE
ncbi:MAG TPA: cytochrome b N-terminal domain-containing protein [Caldisericia bacterium]|nr:cytochrome b N-terminal domain-containing protein [Caldisericia bacterium]HPF48873.1 cytochrome b N-terminal domain-containing protein [Caldisericia bacterium]HPI83263.1 cytochrome b N-terminal domain-containing protein [Caldisericia bacterium]HPQ92490.1 cytochrome b N-terminal domain-containing protein [Caldisericia bacterium]HRV74412.1 cytochrome b N-terminal domain-containing protein [Caldisericia bacterium]